MTVLGVAPPPAGGLDVSLPGAGVRLAATRWPGHGTPVVLLHGLASQRRLWNPVARRLAGLPLLALDQRGHGDSDRPAASAATSGYDAHSVAAALATAMDALGWSRAVVVGHSWGAAVASVFASDHPERTLSLVAIDGGFTSPMRSGGSRAEVRRRLEPPKLEMPPGEVTQLLSTHLDVPWTEEMAAAVLPIFEVGAD